MLAGLAQRVLHEWKDGPGAEAPEVERCDDCDELLGFVDPQERAMAEQWQSWQPPPVGPGGRGTGWTWGPEGIRGGPLGGSGTGWMGIRDEDL